LHIIPGGDYGYQSRYGGSGIHAYLAWNGELPGTLPYAVGLGEAPSGLLDAGTAALPADYHGQLLSSIWEESRIVRIGLSPRGVSVTGRAEVLVEGGEGFRPVAFATDRKGAIYFTDWVLRNYPNHGKGRIWKLAARPDAKVVKPRHPYAPFLPDPAGEPLQEMATGHTLAPPSDERLLDGLRARDPFLRHAAVTALAQPAFHREALEATKNAHPLVRLGALLALRQGAYREAEPVLARLLADPDAQVRQTALRWAGQAGFMGLHHRLDRALSAGPVTPALFETYLETVSHLVPDQVKAYRERSEAYAKSIKRSLPLRFIEQFLADPSRPPALRALAARHLEHPERHQSLITRLLGSEKDTALRLALVQILADVPGPAADQLLQLAVAPSNPAVLRAEALLALAGQPVDVSIRVTALLEDADPDVQLEAVRYLRGRAGDETVRQALLQKYEALQDQRAAPLGEQIALALADGGKQTASPPRPISLAGWDTALAAGGNAERGRRVFYSAYATCAACHAIDGRGGDLGPDLSNVGQSKSRSQLIGAILRPSAQISPEYQGWYVKLNDGAVHQGRQIDVGDKQIELYVQGTGFVGFDKNRVADYGMADRSLMPDGLQDRLSFHDLRDLITFLEAKNK
jgi:putative heme-binding domain-containing protein